MAKYDIEDFDFAFPLGAYGNSSAWSTKRGPSLFRYPELAPRRLVHLAPVLEAEFVSLGAATGSTDGRVVLGDFPFLCKKKLSASMPTYGYVGLTSGAGSALLRSEHGRTYKLKRCGLGEMGFCDQGVKGSSPVAGEDDHYDRTSTTLSGLMSQASAELEYRLVEKFNDCGLCTAYLPCGIIVPSQDLPGVDATASKGSAAVLMEIESDFRIDELVHMTLTPMLADLFAAGRLTYDEHHELFPIFDSHGIPLRRTRRNWAHLSERLFTIGNAVGAAYRRCHEKGYLRGLTSSWPGNEVVHADGRISLIDFDGGATEASTYAEDITASCRRAEIQQYCADSYLFFTVLRPRTLQLYGEDFIEGVWAGYRGGHPSKLPSDLLAGVLHDHAVAGSGLWEGMDFASDASAPRSRPQDLVLTAPDVPTLD